MQVPKTLKVGMQVKGSFRDHVSAMHICNAAGVTLPPVFSFIGKWFNPELLEGAPKGSKTAMQENGYFEQSHMKGFFEHIVEHMDAHPELYHVDGDISKPRLHSVIILDGAGTHVSADAWQYALDHHIDVMHLPPNLTHLMQVADVSVFGPFKTAYRKECEEWRHIRRREMDKFDIALVTGKAWERVMTSSNVPSGFRKTGQWPLDPSAVLDQVLSLHCGTLSTPSLVVPATHPSVCCLLRSLQLTSSDKQMSLRRSLSDITQQELKVQSLESEKERLKERVRQLERQQVRTSELVAEVSAVVNADMTLSGLLQCESHPHPASAARMPKKVRTSKKGHLKGVAPGQLLTQPHIIQVIKEHEQREKEAAERKEAERLSVLEVRKQQRADAAAVKKRQRAEDTAAARQAKRTLPASSSQTAEEGNSQEAAPEATQVDA